MKNFKMKSAAIGVATATLAMSGCTTTAINESKEVALEKKEVVSEKFGQSKKMTRSSTSVKVIDDMFVSGKSFRMSDRDTLPRFFDEKVVYTQIEPVSLQEIIGNVSQSINTRIDLTADAINYLSGFESEDNSSDTTSDSTGEESSVNEQVNYSGSGLVGSGQTFSVSYNGTVAGLLDHITSKTNLYWKWERNHVSFYRMETKNFIFDGDGTEYEFESQVSTSREASEAGEEQSNTKAGSTQLSKVTNKSGSQYDDLEDAIEAMTSDDGKFSISKVQGIVTVTDTPEVLRKVEDYISQINSIVNKRIAVKTEVYEIRIEDTANLGMDINALYNSAIDVAGAAAPNFKGGFNSGGLNFSITDGTSKFNGSSAVIDALARVSNVSLVTSSMNYTTNGKLVPLQIASEKGIVSSMNPVLDDDGNVVGFDAKTGSVLSGLTMNLTPRVNSTGDVDLNFAADLSSLDQIKTVELGEQGGTIDLVDRSFKNFMQRASVDSGDTLMIAGFDRIENKSDVESVGGESVWALGGSKKGGKVRIMTMIMVTPYIMAR